MCVDCIFTCLNVLYQRNLTQLKTITILPGLELLSILCLITKVRKTQKNSYKNCADMTRNII